jgi:hypothetical protein
VGVTVYIYLEGTLGCTVKGTWQQSKRCISRLEKDCPQYILGADAKRLVSPSGEENHKQWEPQEEANHYESTAERQVISAATSLSSVLCTVYGGVWRTSFQQESCSQEST